MTPKDALRIGNCLVRLQLTIDVLERPPLGLTGSEVKREPI
jgi:hypothetical protein